jgi:hypothetical protein
MFCQCYAFLFVTKYLQVYGKGKIAGGSLLYENHQLRGKGPQHLSTCVVFPFNQPIINL